MNAQLPHLEADVAELCLNSAWRDSCDPADVKMMFDMGCTMPEHETTRQRLCGIA